MAAKAENGLVGDWDCRAAAVMAGVAGLVGAKWHLNYDILAGFMQMPRLPNALANETTPARRPGNAHAVLA